MAVASVWLPACGGGAEDESGAGGSNDLGGSSGSGGSSDTGGSSGTGGSGDVCPDPVLITWTEGGEEHHASLVLAQAIGDYFAFNAPACEDDDQVVFRFLPYPLVTGTYELRYHLIGETGEVEPGAQYATEDDGDYSTTTGYTGELVVTAVDTDAGTFSGTFHYDAVDAVSGDDNTDTVSVTDGVITDAPYPTE